MKNLLTKGVIFLMLSFLTLGGGGLISCSQDDDDDDNKSSTSVSAKLKDGLYDAKGGTIKENLTITSPATLQNATMAEGKVITIKVSGVTLDNVKGATIILEIPNADGSFTIKDGNAESVTVKNDGVKVQITGDATVDKTKIEADNVKISTQDNAKITSATIGDAVKNVTLDANVTEVSAKPSTKIEVTTNTKIESVNKDSGDKITVVPQGDASVEDVFSKEGQDKVATLTIKTVVINKDNSVKTQYEEGESFEYKGLTALITYSDDSTATVTLSVNNATVKGFSTGTVGEGKTCTVSYKDKPDSTLTLTYSVKATSKEYKGLINEGITLLNSKDYDGAVSKFSAAYNNAKNDETKMYYALTTIAQLSMNENLKTLLTKNLGLKKYPATINALLNGGDWTKDYVSYTTDFAVYEKKAASTSDDAEYIRMNGTPISYDEYWDLRESDANLSNCYYVSYVNYKGNDGTQDIDAIMDTDVYEDIAGKRCDYIKDATPSSEGVYYVSMSNLTNNLTVDTSSANSYLYEKSGYGDYSMKKLTSGEGDTYYTYVRVSGDAILGNWSAGHRYDTLYEVNSSSTPSEDGSISVDSVYYNHLTDITLSNDGQYFVTFSDYEYYLKLKKVYEENTGNCYSINHKEDEDGDYLYQEIAYENKNLPIFNDIEWLKTGDYSDAYTGSLFNGAESVTSLSFKLLANAIECNPKGLNEVIDTLLKVFTTDIDKVSEIAASMGRSSVTLPSSFIKGLNLDALLGEDSVTIGQSELQCVVGAFHVLNGVLQFISSYDLSMNVSALKELLRNHLGSDKTIMDDAFTKVRALTDKKFLAIRNVGSMDAAKKSISSGLGEVNSAFTSMLSGSVDYYPPYVADALRNYCTFFNTGVKELKDAIEGVNKNSGGENSTLFPIPKAVELGANYVSLSDFNNTLFSIDTAKLFTAGSLSSIIETDEGGKINIYYNTEYYIEGWSSGIEDKYVENDIAIMDSPSKMYDDLKTKIQKDAGESYTYDDDYGVYERRLNVYVKVNTQAIKDICPNIRSEYVPKYIKVYGTDFNMYTLFPKQDD